MHSFEALIRAPFDKKVIGLLCCYDGILAQQVKPTCGHSRALQLKALIKAKLVDCMEADGGLKFLQIRGDGVADDKGDCTGHPTVLHHEHVRQRCQTRPAPAVGLPPPLPLHPRPAERDHQVQPLTPAR